MTNSQYLFMMYALSSNKKLSLVNHSIFKYKIINFVALFSMFNIINSGR